MSKHIELMVSHESFAVNPMHAVFAVSGHWPTNLDRFNDSISFHTPDKKSHFVKKNAIYITSTGEMRCCNIDTPRREQFFPILREQLPEIDTERMNAWFAEAEKRHTKDQFQLSKDAEKLANYARQYMQENPMESPTVCMTMAAGQLLIEHSIGTSSEFIHFAMKELAAQFVFTKQA